MRFEHRALCAAIAITLAAGAASAQVYLNDANITVALGASMPPEPFQNRTTAASLASIIDAPSATAPENHTQATHVWVSGGILELEFDFLIEYDLQTLHFWNYFGEAYDVDEIDFTFFDAGRNLVGTLLDVMPALGGAGGNPIFAEDLPLSFPSKVRYVNAVLSGSNGEVDFNNIGFTAAISCAPGSWSNYGTGWPGTSGVPALTLSATPVLGTTVDMHLGNAATVPAESCLLLGNQAATTRTAFGGTFLVMPVATIPISSVPSAGWDVPWTIPNDPALCLRELFAQLVQFDRGASAGVSFSAGLHITIGGVSPSP